MSSLKHVFKSETTITYGQYGSVARLLLPVIAFFCLVAVVLHEWWVALTFALPLAGLWLVSYFDSKRTTTDETWVEDANGNRVDSSAVK